MNCKQRPVNPLRRGPRLPETTTRLGLACQSWGAMGKTLDLNRGDETSIRPLRSRPRYRSTRLGLGLILAAVVVFTVLFTADLEVDARSEEPTSEHQSLMRLSYAVFCLKK